VRRNLGKIEEEPGLNWLQGHLDYSVAPLLDEPWVLDVDTTIKPLYGEQEGAELGYNPHKPGRPPPSQGQACTAITPTCCPTCDWC